MNEPTLFRPPPADGALTPRQKAVLGLLRASPDGCDDVELGAAAHAAAGCRWCTPGQQCRYASTDGRTIARRLRTLGLARYRRRDGRWHATSGVRHSQNDEIPY